MNLYWVYALPNWLFGVLTVAVTVAIGLGGLWATRKWVLRIHGEEHSHNEVVGFYLGAVCLFYGITLGLLAVGTWQTYTEVETRVGEEAATVGGLYRDVSTLPDPARTELQTDLRRYTREVIDVAWPLQRQGVVPVSEGGVLSAFQKHLSTFEPTTESQKALYAQALREFSQLTELRGRRLQSVNAGLPAWLWIIVLAGAFLNIAISWFFYMKSWSMHVWMTIMLCSLLGLLIFLLGTLDNPFRGEISISSQPFELVYERRMQAEQ